MPAVEWGRVKSASKGATLLDGRYEYDGIPVSVEGPRATAWDVEEGRPFPLASVLDATRLERAEFDELRATSASSA